MENKTAKPIDKVEAAKAIGQLLSFYLAPIISAIVITLLLATATKGCERKKSHWNGASGVRWGIMADD